MLMNSKTIHSEMMKNDTLDFDDESNRNLDAIHITAILEYCILIFVLYF